MKAAGTLAALVGTGLVLSAGAPMARPAAVSPAVSVAAAQSDLDEFMREVLATRDENWKKLQQYVLDEREKLDLRGPGEILMLGQRREYRWYIRDGYFVRSPTTADGVAVPDDERVKYEEAFLRRAKARDERAKAAADGAGSDGVTAAAAAAPPVTPANMDALITQTRQPQFIDSAYFLKFKFEEGKYALVGREDFDGREVLCIEYYPAKLFGVRDDEAARRRNENRSDADRQQNAEIQRLMNKNSLVTLWVEPKSHQIVKYVFDNIQMDFLPAAWLFRIEDLKASMTMGQPFKDVWLPKDVDLYFKAMLALGTIDIRYHLDYVDYQEALTSGRIRREGGF